MGLQGEGALAELVLEILARHSPGGLVIFEQFLAIDQHGDHVAPHDDFLRPPTIFVGDLDVDYAQRAAVAQVLRLAARAANDRLTAADSDGGDSETAPGSSWTGGPWSYGPNDFWLEAVSVVSNLFNVTLHGTTNGSTYLISSTEALNPQANSVWLDEGSLQGGIGNATSFALGIANRTNSIFIRAKACDECATTALPLSWQLASFGATAVDPNSDWDGDGTNNLAEYLGGTDPNKIRFSLSVASRYVNAASVPVQLNIAGGVPSYIAVLINDTNAADASWQAFTATNLTVATPTNGTYAVQVGLCGLATNSAPIWRSLTLVRDATPLTLAITNLFNLSGSRPFIDPAGYASRALKWISWTVVWPTGYTNSGSGSVVAGDWSLDDPYHTTEWFQCYDIPLLLGINAITIEAVDRAGNVAMTNFSYELDNAGDTTIPGVRLVWPQSGAYVCGDSFNVQAWTDDDTGTGTLQCFGTNGTVTTLKAAVERGGNVWVQNVPLAPGTNKYTLTVASAGGYSRGLNFSVIQSDADWTVTPLSQDDLKYGYANVHGTVGDPNAIVTVNDIQATNDGFGNWEADYVPLPPGGTVALQATAHLTGGGTFQTLLAYVRDPIVYTRNYSYKLDYSEPFWAWGKTNNWETHHFETQWARGVGGTDVETDFSYCSALDLTLSNVVVTVWPPDNGYWPFLPGHQVMIQYCDGEVLGIYTNTVGPPPVEWMEQSDAAGSVPRWPGVRTYTEESGRKVGLFTGGQATRQSKVLLGLSASLMLETDEATTTQLWPAAATDFEDFSAFLPEVAYLPSEQISLDPLGNEDSDGMVWSLQPCGTDNGATPQAPVTSFDSQALPSVTAASLQSLTVMSGATQIDATNWGAVKTLTNEWVTHRPPTVSISTGPKEPCSILTHRVVLCGLVH